MKENLIENLCQYLGWLREDYRSSQDYWKKLDIKKKIENTEQVLIDLKVLTQLQKCKL